MDNNITIDRDILLFSIEANSNNFITIDWDEELIKVGSKYINIEDYIFQWLSNGRNNMKQLKVKRIR